jgi:hypothetical protein
MGARIRDVVQGPDGAVYALTDEGNGEILRLTLEIRPNDAPVVRLASAEPVGFAGSNAMPEGQEGTASTVQLRHISH